MDLDDQSWFFGERSTSEQVLRRLDVDSMTGREFEDFVADLMEVTGFDVDRVGGPGDLGADLVARSEPVNMTVQAKRYGPEGSVSRRAVSDAVAAREHYNVESALVATNRTFTSNAREFAQGRCFLVDRGFLGAWAATHEDHLAVGRGGSPFAGMTGTEFEAFLAEMLREQGFAVEEVGGSGDFGVDLIVRFVDETIAIQAKRHSNPISRRAVSDAVSGKGYHDCDEAWVVTSAPGFTQGARTLSESTGARLVGRDELLRWIEEADVDLPGKEAGDSTLASPEQVVDRLRWADDLGGANFGQWTLSLKSGQLATTLSALFLRRVKGEMRLSYQDVPKDTWLGINLPEHRLLSWTPAHSKARTAGNVFGFPLEGRDGAVCIELRADLPAGKGTQAGLEAVSRAIRTVGSREMQVALWSKAPDRHKLAELAERSAHQ